LPVLRGSKGIGESVQERAQRIIETAMELAERGGFEAVRLRDVASQAGVALGTLYRHFRSKEDLLMAALSHEVEELRLWMTKNPPQGATPLDRLTAYFGVATRSLCRKPKLARAVLRSAASGEPELTEKLTQFTLVLEGMIVAALHGESLDSVEPTDQDWILAEILHAVWFAALIAWVGGQHGQSDVTDRVVRAAEFVIRGANAS
jgi:AcrR family transcriptional regulator